MWHRGVRSWLHLALGNQQLDPGAADPAQHLGMNLPYRHGQPVLLVGAALEEVRQHRHLHVQEAALSLDDRTPFWGTRRRRLSHGWPPASCAVDWLLAAPCRRRSCDACSFGETCRSRSACGFYVDRSQARGLALALRTPGPPRLQLQRLPALLCSSFRLSRVAVGTERVKPRKPLFLLGAFLNDPKVRHLVAMTLPIAPRTAHVFVRVSHSVH